MGTGLLVLAGSAPTQKAMQLPVAQPTCCSVSCCSASSSGTPVALNQEVTAAPAMVELAAALLACTRTVLRR